MMQPGLFERHGFTFTFLFFFLVPVFFPSLHAQRIPSTVQLKKPLSEADDRPLSNSAVDLLVRGDTLWVAGGKGLDFTPDAGSTWQHLGDTAPFDLESIAGLAAHENVMWASLAGSEKTDQGSLPKGLGLAKIHGLRTELVCSFRSRWRPRE
jgi:hypothetical protein